MYPLIDVQNELYIFYILFKYKTGFIDKIQFIKEIKDYLFGKCQIFVKFFQIFLLTQYSWGDEFTMEEMNEINNILNNFNYDIDNKRRIGCGSVAVVYIDNNNENHVLKRLLPNIHKNIVESFNKFNNINNIAYLFNLKFLSKETFLDYKDIIIKQTRLDIEVNNLNRMKSMFADIDFVSIPSIINYSKNHIKMTFENGKTLTEFTKLYPNLEEECALKLFTSIKIMIMNKFVHGDLHEGNFLFSLKDINNKKSVILHLIDFGIVNTLDDNIKNVMIDYLESHNIKNRCRLYYELTDKNISFDKFTEIYSKNIKKMETELSSKIYLWRHYGIKINLQYINLLFSLINLKVRLFNKYKKNIIKVLEQYE